MIADALDILKDYGDNAGTTKTSGHVPTTESFTVGYHQNRHRWGKRPKSKKFNGKCNNCHKVGHKEKDCWSKGKSIGGHTRHGSSNNTSDIGMSNEYVFGVVDANGMNFKDIIIDDGSTRRVINDIEMFRGKLKYVKPWKIGLAGVGSSMEVKGEGSAFITVEVGNDKTNVIELKNALYVPNAAKNLLSGAAFDIPGFTRFVKDGQMVVRHGDEVVLEAYRRGLYYVRLASNEVNAIEARPNNDLTLWHLRMGHLNENDVLKMSKEKLVKGMPMIKNNEREYCEPCAVPKITKLPNPPNMREYDKPLDLIYMYLVGPISPVSDGNGKYSIEIKDHVLVIRD